MAEELRVVITAKDGASRVFKEVGAAAKDVGTQAEKAGEQGERGFKRLGDGAQKAKVDTAALGVALTALGAGLAYSSAMAMQQERQLIALNRAFGDNADEVIRYAQELDDLTIFSDDDIRAGQRYFATLQNNYDLSIDQIRELMQVTSELAAASGTTFEDASSRVTAAIRGEGEAAEYLGLTMNQQAIDRQNLTLTMTNQEAAQFRLNALMQQSAPYIGTNNDLMQTGVGTVNNWKDAMQDAAAAVGGFIGPVGTAVTAVGTLGIGLTGLSTGANVAKAALSGLAVAGRASFAALGPVGIAIGAVVLAGVGFAKLMPDLSTVTRDYTDAVDNLNLSLEELRLRGDEALASQLEGFEATLAGYREVWEAGESYEAWAYARGRQPNPLGAQHDEEWRAYNERLAESYELTDDILNKLNQAAFDPNVNHAEYFAWVQDLLDTAAATQTLADDAEALNTIMSTPLSDFSIYKDVQNDVEELTASVSTLTLELNDMRLAGDWELADQLERMNELMLRGGGELTGYADAVDYLNKKVRDGTLDGDAFNAFLAEQGFLLRTHAITWAEYQQNIADYAMDLPQIVSEQERLNAVMAASENALDGVTAATERMGDARREAFAGIGAGVLEVATQGVAEYNEWLEIVTENLQRLIDVAGLDGLNSASTEMHVFALEATRAAESLDTVFRAIVGNTNSIASQVQSVADWATELINVAGEYGKIDDLLASGLITQQQYNDAQLAYNDIASANVQIQEDVLRIQAMQAPIIAQQTQATADYMALIADMPAQQQLIALGWMDSATAARAMEFQTLAVAAATGELGTNGEAAFTSMITGAAQADPVLKALLIDMGLISEGADGTITVNMSGAEGARSEIGMLTDAIVAFIDLTDDGTLNGSFSITAEDNASEVIRTVRGERDELDGSVATISIALIDGASFGISAAQAALNALDGRVATTTIRTVYEQRGLGPTMANGGVVSEYADGGVVIRAGEISPEIISFANGGMAVLPTDGLYSVPVGSYISPGHASVSRLDGGVNVQFNGNFYGSNRAELDEWAQTSLVPAFVDALQDERRGQAR